MKRVVGQDTSGLNTQIGFLLGFIAVSAFALTLPITKFLTPVLSIWDIGLGRSLLAAVAALLILILKRQPVPSKLNLVKLCITASGIAFGFPVLTAVGMQSVPASHGGIVLGGLPLATALMGCFLSSERPSVRFWLVSLTGFAVIAVFSLTRQGGVSDLSFYTGDLALVGAVLFAGLGYAQGGILARELGGWQVICWTLVVSLPLLVVTSVWLVDVDNFKDLSFDTWSAFLFLSLVNSLIGFFFWYGGMALGGVARVSQIQLLQTFLTILFSALWLEEVIDTTTFIFMCVTVFIVWLSKRTPVFETK